MIVFKNVNKLYNKGFHAVENMNLHINEGELFALIGPSGSGKSTTMKMINRLIEPTSGTVLINNKNIAEENPVALRRNIGYDYHPDYHEYSRVFFTLWQRSKYSCYWW